MANDTTEYPFLPAGKKFNTPTLQELSASDAKQLLERTENFFANKPDDIRLGRRPISESDVTNLLNSMNNGDWNPAVVVPIIISASKGILLDGNHRMTALSRTNNLTFIFVVSYVDLANERDVALKVDTGRKRTANTGLIISGLSAKKTTKMASIVRLLYFMAGHPSSKTINTFEYVKIAEKYPQLMAYVDNWEISTHIPERFVYAMDFVLREFLHDENADAIRDSMLGVNRVSENDPIWEVKELFDLINSNKAKNTKKTIKFNDGTVIYTLMDAYKKLKSGRSFPKKLKSFPSFPETPYFDAFNLEILKAEKQHVSKKVR